MSLSTNIVVFLALIAIILVLLDVLGFFGQEKSENKEGFVASPNGAYRTSTNSYGGHNLMTDGMIRGDIKSLDDVYDKTGQIYDNTTRLGASPGNGFDKPYENQTAIQDMTKDNDGSTYTTFETLDAISRKIGSNQSNANNNIYTRAGGKPTKLIIEPNGIRGVIDAKYLPDRDKNYQIATVSTIVPVQGYDVNIERLGEYLSDTHFSQISKHSKHVRVPTAAGAVGGGTRMNSNIEEALGEQSATSEAVANNISVQDNKLLIKDDKGQVAVNLDQNANSESFRSKYVRGNHQ